MPHVFLLIAVAALINSPAMSQNKLKKDPKSALETYSLMMGYMASCVNISGPLTNEQRARILDAVERIGFDKDDRNQMRLVDIHLQDLAREIALASPRRREEQCLETRILFDGYFPK